MAYNSYFPATYQPNYYGAQNPYYAQQAVQQPIYQQNAAQQAQQIQSQPVQQPIQQNVQQGGFVRVQSENEARMYPVAPGNSVTFIDETAPYCYTKTMDMSQLDRPKFEKYRLVKEEDAPVSHQSGASASNGSTAQNVAYAQKSDLDAIWNELDALKAKLEQASKKTPVKVKKQEVDDDE